jgi:6-pyruvoyltetrahydropterin/6-carboxytetrahydropterin synthase
MEGELEMYEVSVRDHFDAAHYLRGYEGKCESLHGHRFQVVVSVMAEQVDDIGLAYDFTRLKQQLREILGEIDHTCLNEIPPFDNINPSSENIALTIYKELQTKLEGAGVSISSVQVWESPESSVTYFPK